MKFDSMLLSGRQKSKFFLILTIHSCLYQQKQKYRVLKVASEISYSVLVAYKLVANKKNECTQSKTFFLTKTRENKEFLKFLGIKNWKPSV